MSHISYILLIVASLVSCLLLRLQLSFNSANSFVLSSVLFSLQMSENQRNTNYNNYTFVLLVVAVCLGKFFISGPGDAIIKTRVK